VTSLSRLLSRPIDTRDVQDRVASHFEDVFK